MATMVNRLPRPAPVPPGFPPRQKPSRGSVACQLQPSIDLTEDEDYDDGHLGSRSFHGSASFPSRFSRHESTSFPHDSMWETGRDSRSQTPPRSLRSHRAYPDFQPRYAATPPSSNSSRSSRFAAQLRDRPHGSHWQPSVERRAWHRQETFDDSFSPGSHSEWDHSDMEAEPEYMVEPSRNHAMGSYRLDFVPEASPQSMARSGHSYGSIGSSSRAFVASHRGSVARDMIAPPSRVHQTVRPDAGLRPEEAKRVVWTERIHELVADNNGLWMTELKDKWNRRWKDKTFDLSKPCKKLKDAVERYVKTVYVSKDLKVYLKENSGGEGGACSSISKSPQPKGSVGLTFSSPSRPQDICEMIIDDDSDDVEQAGDHMSSEIDASGSALDPQSKKEEFARRITELAMEKPEGLHLNGVQHNWKRKWPDDNIDHFKPCKKIKSAVNAVKDIAGIILNSDTIYTPDVDNDADDTQEPAEASAEASAHPAKAMAAACSIQDPAMRQQEWAKRITELARNQRVGLFTGGVAEHWKKKWPDEPIERYRPCKKVKDAVSRIQKGIHIDDENLIYACVELKDDQLSYDEEEKEAVICEALNPSRCKNEELKKAFDGIKNSFESMRWPRGNRYWWTTFHSFIIADGTRLVQVFRCYLQCKVQDGSKKAGDEMVDEEPVDAAEPASDILGVWNCDEEMDRKKWWDRQLFVWKPHRRKSQLDSADSASVCYLQVKSNGEHMQGELQPDTDAPGEWKGLLPEMFDHEGESYLKLQPLGTKMYVAIETDGEVEETYMVVKAEKCCWTGFGVHPRAALASAMRTALKMAPPNLMSRVGPSPFVAAKQSVEDVLRCVVRGHQCESEEQGDEHIRDDTHFHAAEDAIAHLVEQACFLLSGEEGVDLTDDEWKSSKVLEWAWPYAAASSSTEHLEQLGKALQTALEALGANESWCDSDTEKLMQVWVPLLQQSLRVLPVQNSRGSREWETAESALKQLSPEKLPKSCRYAAHFLALLHHERLTEIQSAAQEAENAGSMEVFAGVWSKSCLKHRAEVEFKEYEPDLTPSNSNDKKRKIMYPRRGDLAWITPRPHDAPDVAEGVLAEVRNDFEEGGSLKLKLFSITLPSMMSRVSLAMSSSEFSVALLQAMPITHDRQVEAVKALSHRNGRTYDQSIRSIIVKSWEAREATRLASEEEGIDFDAAQEDDSLQKLAAGLPDDLQGRRDELEMDLAEGGDGIPLDDTQRKAVHHAAWHRCSLVRGPPGTGKTHTACSIINAWTQQKLAHVLVVAQSNTAAFNIQERMNNFDVPCIRVGSQMSANELLDQKSFREAVTEREMESLYNVGNKWAPVKPSILTPLLQKVVEKTKVVVMTCISAGNWNLLRKERFCRVLIDEAAQVLEPTALVPLMAGAKAFVCIGDDKQLPAKVDSREAKRLKFEESLFERLLQAKVVEEDNGFVQLDIQRRMHSSISAFPSRHFYENSVVDGCSDDERPPIDAFAWPQEGSVRVCFVDMQSCGDGEESVGTSKQNTTEAELLEKVLTHILSGGLQPKEVAVVSGYAAQRGLLRRLIPDESIRIDTVDGFQGMERDLVLVSTARSNMSGKVGFLADPRRANVLLTRARRGLIVFGNYSTLVKEESSWKPWLDWVHEQEAYRTAEGIEKLLC